MKSNKEKNKHEQQHLIEDVPKDTLSAVKRLLKYLLRQKWKLIIITGCSFLSSLAYAAMPLTVGMAVNRLLVLIRDGSSRLLSDTADALFLPITLLAASTAVACILFFVQQYTVASVGEKLTLALRNDVAQKISKLPLKYFDAHKTGDVMSRVSNDLEKVSEVMQVGLMQFISSCFTIILTFGAMLFLSPKLFLVVLCTIIVSTFATSVVSSLSQKFYAENQAAMGALNMKTEEFYSGNKVIKVFNQQDQVIDTLCQLNEDQFRANRKAQFANFAIYPAIRLINELGFIVTAIVGGLMALSGSLSLGAVQAFLQYVNQISEPITQTSYVVTSLRSAVAGAERVFELLDEQEESSDSETTASSVPIREGRVCFEHINFGYVTGKPLIKDLSLEVKPNETVAIVGPTGGGKTTLLNLLMRFYEIDGGKITVDGTNITSMPRGALRKHVGMVLQDTWLFEGTVAENLAYGNRGASLEEIVSAAKAARCDHFIRTLPQGYDTVISAESSNISQGQMQLLTIARAMLTNPSIMILDEATSSVDTRTEAEIQQAMTHLMKDKTSFVIAHRLSTIKNADLILVVKDGDIIERGTHHSLLEEKGFYHSLYYSQFETA